MSSWQPNQDRRLHQLILRKLGKWSTNGLNVVNRCRRDESEIVSVHAAGAEDVDIAVKAARKALKDPSWKELPPTDRGKLMLKLADLVEKHIETLATIESWDNGWSLQFSRKYLDAASLSVVFATR